MHTARYREHRVVAFVNRQHQWFRRKSVTMAELASQPLVLREQGSTTRRALERALARRGLKAQPVFEIGSREGVWGRGDEDELNKGYKIRLKEGYFPTPPMDSMQNIRSEMVAELMNLGIPVEAHHHEVATGGQCEIDMRYQDLVTMADSVMMYKYVCKNVAARHGKVVTFMPKPLFQDNGSGMHVHFSLWKGDKPLFAGNKYAGLS